MGLDVLKADLPEYAKDLKLNLGSVVGNSKLAEQTLWGTVLADVAGTLAHNLTRSGRTPPRFERAAVNARIEPLRAAKTLAGEKLLRDAMTNAGLRARGPIGAQPFLHLDEGEPAADKLANPVVRVSVPVE